MKKTLTALCALLIATMSHAATPWQTIHQPISGAPQSIGAFSNGCIIGAQPLPLEASGYQVMRTDQRRFFGHPDLIAFIQRLSTQTHQLGLGEVLVGDMGMAAGGASAAVTPAISLVWTLISGFSYRNNAGHNRCC